MIFNYLGAVTAGNELIQIVTYGSTIRYISTNQVGHVSVFDEKSEGNLPIRIQAIKGILQAIPPGMTVTPVHPGNCNFFGDFAKCVEAQVLETED